MSAPADQSGCFRATIPYLTLFRLTSSGVRRDEQHLNWAMCGDSAALMVNQRNQYHRTTGGRKRKKAEQSSKNTLCSRYPEIGVFFLAKEGQLHKLHLILAFNFGACSTTDIILYPYLALGASIFWFERDLFYFVPLDETKPWVISTTTNPGGSSDSPQGVGQTEQQQAPNSRVWLGVKIACWNTFLWLEFFHINWRKNECKKEESFVKESNNWKPNNH